MVKTIEELREYQRNKNRAKNNIPPERWVNGRSHPDNVEYHRELKRRYYHRHKEELSKKKKEWYERKKQEIMGLINNNESRQMDKVGDQGEDISNWDKSEVPWSDGQERHVEPLESDQGQQN
jgi:hypothetical protein